MDKKKKLIISTVAIVLLAAGGGVYALEKKAEEQRYNAKIEQTVKTIKGDLTKDLAVEISEDKLEKLKLTIKDSNIYKAGEEKDERVIAAYAESINKLKRDFKDSNNQVIEENVSKDVKKEKQADLTKKVEVLIALKEKVELENDTVYTKDEKSEIITKIDGFIKEYNDQIQVLKEKAAAEAKAKKEAEAKKKLEAEKKKKAEEKRLAEEQAAAEQVYQEQQAQGGYDNSGSANTGGGSANNGGGSNYVDPPANNNTGGGSSNQVNPDREYVFPKDEGYQEGKDYGYLEPGKDGGTDYFNKDGEFIGGWK